MSGISRRKALAGIAGGLAVAAGSAGALRLAAKAQGLASVTRPGTAFGTTISLTAVHKDRRALDAALADAFGEIRRIERSMSLFDPTSDLSRLNRVGRLDRPDATLVEVLRFALRMAALTNGAFDPTVQPLWTVWAEAARTGVRPNLDELAKAKARIGFEHVAVFDERIAFERPGMAVTLNGVAQGYAADRVIGALRRHGVQGAFVDTGEFGAIGRRADDGAWSVGVAHPRRESEMIATLSPFEGFAATSGDDQSLFSPDRRDHHILDPRTGRSPTTLSLVTIHAPCGMLADALSTAAFVIGPDAARSLAEQCGARPPILVAKS